MWYAFIPWIIPCIIILAILAKVLLSLRTNPMRLDRIDLVVSGGITVDHRVLLPPGKSLAEMFAQLEANLTSKLGDRINAVSGALTTASNRVEADFSDLNKHVANLQAAVDRGSFSQSDIDALAELKRKLDALEAAQEQLSGDQSPGDQSSATQPPGLVASESLTSDPVSDSSP